MKVVNSAGAQRIRITNMPAFKVQPSGKIVDPKPKLGSGARFKSLEKRLSAQGAKNPGALAAYIGRKVHGKAKFQKMAAAGRKRHKGY